jgi:methylated-DNA-[protein]-cysteine S-methyltransferase
MPSTVVDSPIGPLALIASEAGLQSVLFDGGRIRPEGSSPVLGEAARQLEAYFDSDPVTFDLPLELHGTEFNCRCWLALASIPFGQTVSYGEQARRLGLGNDAARAVGAANGRNPLPIVFALPPRDRRRRLPHRLRRRAPGEALPPRARGRVTSARVDLRSLLHLLRP